jgi:two-component system, chemotaxis family, sensor kinase Cph1
METSEAMDLTRLTNDQLEAALKGLQSGAAPDAMAFNQLEDAVRELQVHRFELEMQNRALRRSEGDLEHSLQRYADLYDFAPVGLITLTPRGRIHEANLTAAELLWLERQKTVGSYFRHFLDQEDSVQFAVFLERCLSSSSRMMVEVFLRPKGGAAPLCVQLTGQAITEAHTRERFVRIAISDITSLKQAERVLAERGSEQGNLFQLAGERLQGLVSEIEAVCEQESEKRPAKQQLDALKTDADGMRRLMEKLAMYSRLSFSPVILGRVETDALVREIAAGFEPIVQQRRGRLIVNHPLPAAYASEELLKDAISRAVDNALKFTRDGHPPVVRISSLQVSGRAVLMISDEGRGLTREEQQKLFGLTDHLVVTGARSGAGLGLPIVQKTMLRMNGRCWMESKPNEGCCFYLELPEA